MTPEKWIEVKRIFNEAVELSAEEREKFLAGRTNNGDDELRREVEKLLHSDEQAETLFDGKTLLAAPRDFSADERIGNYKIIKKIGEGGMGAVFLAERADLKQRVALKIIRRGADSDQILKRFRREQEILAALEHPNIARLIDVGVSENGVSFLAMEYVEGADLTAYIRRTNPAVGEKLILFRKICDAVSYAHSRLVVHRDLKPSNIIVNEAGEPKLLDFGISKLISESESSEDKGTVTSMGMLTPNYASPEQFRGETVSTSTDVYSLGVILFELLTDALPYEITGKRIDEVARAVIETEPERPSSVVVSGRWSAVGKTAENGERRTNGEDQRPKTKDQRPKTKDLKGDLDNIILKALRKEPARRYFSVEQFSEDLRRHLAGLPVTARPDTFSYRAEKFIGRNRAAVVSAALVFLVLLAGVVGISWQYVRAERERKLAEQRFAQVRSLANNVVFKYHDGIANLPGSTEIRRMLVNDATEYLDHLAQDAGGNLELQRELANAYVKLADVQGKTYYSNVGDTAGAMANYQKAVEILEKIHAQPDAKNQAADDLIAAYQTLGMMQSRVFAYTDSVASSAKALRLVEEKAALAPDDVNAKYQVVRANGRYADSLRKNGQYTEAMEIFRRSLTLAEAIFRRAPEHENNRVAVAVLHDRVARLLFDRAIELKRIGAPPEMFDPLFAEAETNFQQAFVKFEKLVADYPEKKKYRRDFSTAHFTLGSVYRETGRLDESRQIIETDLRNFREKVAAIDAADRESQYDLSDGLDNLAQTKTAQKQFAAAFADYERAVEIYDRLLAADPTNMEFRGFRFETENRRADALRQSGDRARALEIYQAAFERLKQDAPENPYLVYAEGVMNENVGDCYREAMAAEKNSFHIERAREAYRKTWQLWQPEEIRRRFLGFTPERLDFLERKIADADQFLAKLSS